MPRSYLFLFSIAFGHFVQRPYRNLAMAQLGANQLYIILTGSFCLSALALWGLHHAERKWGLVQMLAISCLSLALLYACCLLWPIYPLTNYLYLLSSNTLNLMLLSLGWLVLGSTGRPSAVLVAQHSLVAQAAALVGALVALCWQALLPPQWILLLSLLSWLVAAAQLMPIARLPTSISAQRWQWPALLSISGYVLLYTMLATVFYFLLLATLTTRGEPAQQQVAQLAGLDVIMHTLALFAGWLATRRCIGRQLGFWGMPLLALLLLIGLLIALGYWQAALAFALFKGLHHLLSRPQREQALIQQAHAQGAASKVFADTLSYRLGDMLGSWYIALLCSWGWSLHSVLWAALPLALLWLWVAHQVLQHHPPDIP